MQSHFREIYLSIKSAPAFKGLDLGLGEILSYLIVKSDRFQAFLNNVVHHYPKYAKLDLNNVAQLIIHAPSNELTYMGNIISGPYDADKLDYLVRDCYFCGIQADVDVERILVSVALLDRKRFHKSNPKWAHIPVLVFSNSESPRDICNCYSLNVYHKAGM